MMTNGRLENPRKLLYIWKQSVSFEINNDVNFTGKQLGLFFFELTSGDKETKQKWAP